MLLQPSRLRQACSWSISAPSGCLLPASSQPGAGPGCCFPRDLQPLFVSSKHCNGLGAFQVAGHAAFPLAAPHASGVHALLLTAPEPPRTCPSAVTQSSLFTRPAHRKSYAGSNYSHMNSEEKEVELPPAPHLNGTGPAPGTSPKPVSGPPLTPGARSKSEAAVQPILDQAAVKAQEAQKAQEGHKSSQVGKALNLASPHRGLEAGCAGGDYLPAFASAGHVFAGRWMWD